MNVVGALPNALELASYVADWDRAPLVLVSHFTKYRVMQRGEERRREEKRGEPFAKLASDKQAGILSDVRPSSSSINEPCLPCLRLTMAAPRPMVCRAAPVHIGMTFGQSQIGFTYFIHSSARVQRESLTQLRN